MQRSLSSTKLTAIPDSYCSTHERSDRNPLPLSLLHEVGLEQIKGVSKGRETARTTLDVLRPYDQ